MKRWWDSERVYERIRWALSLNESDYSTLLYVTHPRSRAFLLTTLANASSIQSMRQAVGTVHSTLREQYQEVTVPFTFSDLWKVIFPILKEELKSSTQSESRKTPEVQKAPTSSATDSSQRSAPAQPSLMPLNVPDLPAPASSKTSKRRRVKGSQTKYYTGNYPRVERLGPGNEAPPVPSGTHAQHPFRTPLPNNFQHQLNTAQPSGHYPQIGSTTGEHLSKKKRSITSAFPRIGSTLPNMPQSKSSLPAVNSEQKSFPSTPQPKKSPEHPNVHRKPQLLTKYPLTQASPWWDAYVILDDLRAILIEQPNAEMLLNYLKHPTHIRPLLHALEDASRILDPELAIEELYHWFIYSTYEKRLQWSPRHMWSFLKTLLRKSIEKSRSALRSQPTLQPLPQRVEQISGSSTLPAPEHKRFFAPHATQKDVFGVQQASSPILQERTHNFFSEPELLSIRRR